MQKKEISFSDKQLLKLIWPLIVESFLALAVGLADSIMVAGVGEAAVSGVSLVDSVNVLIINTFTALAAGGAVVSGQLIGKGDMKKAADSAVQLIVFMGVLSVAVTAVLYAVHRPMLRTLFGDIEADVMGHSIKYFLIVEASVPFLALYSAGAAIFRVMGNSAVSMKISLLMNTINVGGNALMIYGFGCGVEGVAVPTLASRAVAAVLVLTLLRDQRQPLHLPRPFRYRYDPAAIGQIFRLGVPNGIEGSLFQLGKILLLSAVSSFGTASIAANAVGNTIAGFQVLPASAIGTAMVTVVSQCVGAGDFEKARYYVRRMMAAAYISMFALNVVLVFLYPSILQLYGISQEAVRLGLIILWMHGGFGVVMWPAAFAFPNALKAAGDTRFTMVSSVASMWIFRFLFGLWFARGLGFGVLGIWMSMFIDWACRIICFLVRWHGGKWQSKGIR
ncbi:MAG: MATE family efflux transporter [Oscillospiraceae bacterium]|nr:MATE family efflux transporter [Oscillospiraceae bacterium]